MAEIKITTAGESHGKALVGIISGLPSGLALSADYIDAALKRRQQGHGRGGRMKIESDRVEILTGVRWGKTLGTPLTLKIENRDWQNWQKGMSTEAGDEGSIPPVTRPRPGHADLAGALKYDFRDIRNVLERSSARETAMRVAAGAVCKKFLNEFGVFVGSYVIQIGSVGKRRSQMNSDVDAENYSTWGRMITFDDAPGDSRGGDATASGSRTPIDAGARACIDTGGRTPLKLLHEKADASIVRCPDENDSAAMVRLIDKAAEKGDTLGGIFEVFATGLPPGLGSHTAWDTRLDARLAAALVGIQAVKGVEFGMGFEAGRRFGSEVMDEIYYDKTMGFYRKSNYAGGIEGGMTNSMPLVARAVMKPIPTQKKPLKSVDISTKKSVEAAYERSDVCAVPACSVIAEAMCAIVIANAFMEKFAGDSIGETLRNYHGYLLQIKEF